MKKALLMVVVLLIGIVGFQYYFGPASPADWQRLCEVMTEASMKSEDPAVRATLMADAVRTRGPWPRSITNAFTAVANVDRNQKMELLKEAAKESGAENWNCPVLMQ
jgi:hypothetical protein